MRSASLTLLATTAMLALAGCSADAEVSFGDKTLNAQEAEQNINSALEDTYGEAPERLTCPDGVDAVKGETFVCEGISPAPESRPFAIEVTMTDDEGGIRYPTQVTFTDGPNGAEGAQN